MSQQNVHNLLHSISSPSCPPAGRPLSHGSTEGSSDRSSPSFEERQDDFVPPEDDAILKQTTVVVKAVMELSNKVPLSRPSDYVEFVKVRERKGKGAVGTFMCRGLALMWLPVGLVFWLFAQTSAVLSSRLPVPNND